MPRAAFAEKFTVGADTHSTLSLLYSPVHFSGFFDGKQQKPPPGNLKWRVRGSYRTQRKIWANTLQEGQKARLLQGYKRLWAGHPDEQTNYIGFNLLSLLIKPCLSVQGFVCLGKGDFFFAQRLLNSLSCVPFVGITKASSGPGSNKQSSQVTAIKIHQLQPFLTLYNSTHSSYSERLASCCDVGSLCWVTLQPQSKSSVVAARAPCSWWGSCHDQRHASSGGGGTQA